MPKQIVKKASKKEKEAPVASGKTKSKHKLDADLKNQNDAVGHVAKKAKSPAIKKGKPAKKKNDAELDDDLLADDVESGEEIPGLEEFSDDESAEDSDDDLDSEISADGSEDAVEDAGDDELEVSGELSSTSKDDDEVVLTDAEGRRLCRVRDCDQAAIVETYCRFHYLQNWKRIQVRRRILADGKLERYVDELTSRYPDKFLEMIRKDLRTEKEFLTAIAELEIDENAVDNEFEDENQNFIDEVRGVSETSISEEEEF